MKLSITIQAHPHRREMAQELAREAGATITWDPDPDGQYKAAWRTYRHALETTPADATHRLVIQDDAAVCQHFEQTATAAVAATPQDGLLCLFVPGALYAHTSALDLACSEDRTITELPLHSWVPVVATCWPAEIVPFVLDWVDEQNWPAGFHADDEIVGRFTRDRNIPVFATMPSLVDHPDDVASLVGSREPGFGNNVNRVAHCYIGDDVDPRGIAWSL